MEILNPADPDKMGVATINKFVSLYVKKITILLARANVVKGRRRSTTLVVVDVLVLVHLLGLINRRRTRTAFKPVPRRRGRPRWSSCTC